MSDNRNMGSQSISNYPALFWNGHDDEKVQCVLCPFNCLLSKGKIGICKGKQNIGGRLIAINYGLTTSLSLDPIEKKPLYHFHPGASILSIGPNGCNLRCNFCQNYHVSQNSSDTYFLSPQTAVEQAASKGSIGMAYTYSEPLMWYEYVLDTSIAMREQGFKNVLVTNGLINAEPLARLLPHIDALNIDIKSMNRAFYKKTCKGPLEPVLESVRMAAKSTHVEVTNLVIPGLNDTDDMFEKLADFIADINPLIPLHFSRYHTDYQQTAPATPEKTLLRAKEIAIKKLKYVYIGNVYMDNQNQTACPDCNELLIERMGYRVTRLRVENGKCACCGADTGIVTS